MGDSRTDGTATTTNVTEKAGQVLAGGALVTLFLRLVSFLCTQLTIRSLDPATLGKASIQLELLLTTVLFITREGFRLSLTQQTDDQKNWAVAWLTIPVVTIVSGAALIWHIFVSISSDDKDYRLAGMLYCLACWIEGCAEPAVLFLLRRLEVAKRVSAEGIATVCKTFATVLGLRLFPVQWQVTAFGVAQVVYATTYALYLYGNVWSRPDWKIGLPSSTKKLWGELDSNTCYVTLIFTLQGFFKHLLTEADKIVLAAMADSYDQGVYAMGASYGSMAARILLQPLEENARLLWSRLASVGSDEMLEESYKSLLKLVLYIGFFFCCLAVNYTNLLLNILAGRTWGQNAEAANVLSAFCVYTAFLALNGMTEALVYAVSGTNRSNLNTTTEMAKLGFAHTFTGVVFAIAASFLVGQYGTIGLVGANCIAMSIRSIYSLVFAARFFEGMRKEGKSLASSFAVLLSQVFPPILVLTSFAATYVATRFSLESLMEKSYHLKLQIRDKDWLLLTGRHVAIGVSCVIGIMSIMAFSEKPFLRSLSGLVKRKQKDA
ncbi:Rft domain containing protein [Nitzschia inconspicua]|uniref:Protein RFT1 homolog n=1 Tax=Nitzschia inconspicua TaxID=303405 RepID=A0A9K3LDL1_9STRA|nr:Rft domain containing protein [Nitzschia inconspicua]